MITKNLVCLQNFMLPNAQLMTLKILVICLRMKKGCAIGSQDFICQQDNTCDLPFTEAELSLAISELPNSAIGNNGIHNQMLRDLPIGSRPTLLSIFNDIWESGCYPTTWKVSSKVIPLLKPNKDRYNIKSYRPVVLTSCLGKLYERLVNQRLQWALYKKNKLHASQFGFRPFSGTVDPLLNITEKCHEGLHLKQYTVVVFLDFGWAFDRVWWKGLITKAATLNIQGNMLNFLRSFLSERAMQVQMNSHSSTLFELSAGTPPGCCHQPHNF